MRADYSPFLRDAENSRRPRAPDAIGKVMGFLSSREITAEVTIFALSGCYSDGQASNA
jgi:hypothetical protein